MGATSEELAEVVDRETPRGLPSFRPFWPLSSGSLRAPARTPPFFLDLLLFLVPTSEPRKDQGEGGEEQGRGVLCDLRETPLQDLEQGRLEVGNVLLGAVALVIVARHGNLRLGLG